MADSVAKVFLRHGSQILRGVGAAIVACFVLWREFSSCGFWDFCNTIGTFRTCPCCRRMSDVEGMNGPSSAAAKGLKRPNSDISPSPRVARDPLLLRMGLQTLMV